MVIRTIWVIRVIRVIMVITDLSYSYNAEYTGQTDQITNLYVCMYVCISIISKTIHD